jgi:CRP-like cAMP-binding protein
VAEHPFCKGLESYYVELLAGCASNVYLQTGQHLFREGGEANHFYLIREGRIALEVFAPSREPIVTEAVHAGEVLGWSWLVPPYRWHFDARVVEPVRALAVQGKCLRAKCEKNHDLGYELLKRVVDIVGRRVESTRLRMLDLYAADAHEAELVFER